MKKISILLSCLLIMLTATACAQEVASSLELKQEVNELTAKFNYETAKCLVDKAMVEYTSLNRGDVVQITNEDDDYYYFDYKGVLVAVEKEYIRTEKEDAFKPYSAYTRNGVKMYADIQGKEEITSFSLNDVVNVVDSFAGMLYVECDGVYGYMYKANVSKDKIIIYIPPTPVNPPVEDNNSGSGGSSSGDSSSGDSGSSSSSGDGEDITLSAGESTYQIVLLAAENEFSGTVLMDGTKAYFAVYNRGDVVKILSEDEKQYEVLVNGLRGKLEKDLIRKDSEEDFKTFEAYATRGASIYSDYQLTNKVSICYLNDVINIVDETNDVYVIERSNGTIAYMDKEEVSKEKIKVYVAPQIQTPVNEDNSGSSSSDDSSSSGGSSEEQWTEPVL